MKHQLLALALLAISTAPISAQNCNLPAPLADICQNAPLLCGNYLEGYCSTTAGLTPDQPVSAGGPIPLFENNGWLRISPCFDSIAIDFQVSECQVGNELRFFLLSGECDTMTLRSFASAQDGSVAHLMANGLTPGEIYFLVVDGLTNAECKFQTHVVYGIGTAAPGPVLTCDCTNNYVDGPVDVCPGEIVQYSIVAGSCTMTFGPPVGGNGYFCCPPPPDACPSSKDSSVLHWIVPSWMTILGDSINVTSITVQVDSSLLGIDTILSGTVSYYWEIIHLPSDSTVFCSCCVGCKPGDAPLDVVMHHDVEISYCTLTCVQPCCIVNGQSYCAPGTYIVEQTNCLTKKLVVTADWAMPLAVAGPGGILNCFINSLTLGSGSSSGPNYTYHWSGPGISPSGNNQPFLTVTAPGAYTLLVTNTANGCTDTDMAFVTQDFSIPSVTIPPLPKVCQFAEVTLTANANPSFVQYTWSNNMMGQQITIEPPSTSSYSVTVSNPANGCTNTASVLVEVTPNIIMNLPPKTICEGDCVWVAGDEFCSPGHYLAVTQSFQGCDSIISFSINVIPYLVTNHGIVGTLTCEVPSISFMGNTYNQPGNYAVPKANGCGEHQFSIDLDVLPPLVALGQPQEICAGQAATLAISQILQDVEYTWSNGAIGTQIEVSPTATATYSVTGQNLANGCTNTASLMVEVMPAIYTNLGPQNICEGECVWVAGEELCSSGVYSVVASSYQGCDSIITVLINVMPYVVTNHGIVGTLTCEVTSISFMGNTYNQPGNYAVPKANGCGEHQFSIDLDVLPPLVALGQPQEICAGQTVTLAVSPILQGVEYTWSNGTIGTQIEVSPTATETYAVTAQNLANGCLAFDLVTVNVVQSVDTDLGVIGTLDCTQLEINFLGNTYTQPGQYTVPIPGGCGNNLFIILGNSTPPWCPIIPVPPVCAGESTSLQTAPLSPSNLSYLWSTGETTQEVTVTPFATTTYTLTATDPSTGCTSIIATTVEVNQPQLVPLGLVGTLTCAQPCLTFNGLEYCQPGTYSVTENCEIKEFQIAQDLALLTVQLGVVGTLTCALPCLTYNGLEYCQPGTYSVTENCEIKEFQIAQDLALPTVQLGVVGTLTCAQPCLTFNSLEYCQPGTYSVTENCEIKEFQIAQDLALPTVQLGVVGILTCAQPCLTFNGLEYCQPGTYSVTENCEIKEFQIAQDLALPTVQLGVVGTLTCALPCLNFNGVEYCQPGTYSVTENCEIKEFQIAQDLALPTVQLGVVGTLTCAQPCLTFNGLEYCQPGTYSVTENCEIKEFQIAQDLALPTVQLGVVGTLTCAQPCLTYNGVEYCQPGAYSVTGNCENIEFQIGDLPPVWLELGEDQTIAADESAELLGQTNAIPAIITWHNSTDTMPETHLGITVQPMENTLYFLEIQDLNGCLLQDSVWVLVEGGWYAPNVIRPLSAELNGWFTLFASPNHVAEIQLLEIFDRWGNMVFSRKNFPPNQSESGWNGTHNGQMVNPAVFVWKATLLLKNGSTEQVVGDVTVVR